jgi:thiol-disulfide isomerase/thioredoxin
MKIAVLFIFSLLIIPSCWLCAQPSQADANFVMTGTLAGRDTGTIVLTHFDRYNKGIADTITLNKGKFRVTGTVNGACEALLWTDLKNRYFDDSSVIRFLLEPGNISIVSRKEDALHPLITGSAAESEKDDWDKEKQVLLTVKRRYYEAILALGRRMKTDTTSVLRERQTLLGNKMDSISRIIRALDVKYILKHQNSYLSGYLLYQQRRRLPVDSLQMIYSMLGADVKKSSLGFLVLKDLYPLTNDNEFRKANPLVDLKFDERLMGMQSVFDIGLRDTAGNMIQLNAFKGKYLVIDFWASWCKPCMENIPALDGLTARYKSDSVQFISISMDQDIKAWKSAIVAHRFGGVQLSDTTGFSGLAAIYCKALWVPTYVVAGPDGRIIKYDAPQAVNPQLAALLDNLLRRGLVKPEAAR